MAYFTAMPVTGVMTNRLALLFGDYIHVRNVYDSIQGPCPLKRATSTPCPTASSVSGCIILVERTEVQNSSCCCPSANVCHGQAVCVAATGPTATTYTTTRSGLRKAAGKHRDTPYTCVSTPNKHIQSFAGVRRADAINDLHQKRTDVYTFLTFGILYCM